ncbi:29_t:CDS:2, partial [Funneliformis mosseae]
PKLNQRHLTEIDTGNYSTGSLGGGVGAPRFNSTRNAYDDAASIINSSLSNHDQRQQQIHIIQTSTPLVDRETYNLGHTGDQNYHRQDDQKKQPVIDREANNDKFIAKPEYTLQIKSVNSLEFPLTVNCKADDVNNPVIMDFVAACTPDSETNAPPLRLGVDVELFIWGKDWIYKPKISVPIPVYNVKKVLD